MNTSPGSRITAGMVLTVTLLAPTACGSGSHDPQSAGSATTSSVVSPSPAQDQYDQLALQLLDDVVNGDYEAVTTHFDTQMAQQLTSQGLASAWTEYQQQFGEYQSHGDPQDVAHDELTVVNVPLQMAKMPGEFRVTFRDDKTVAGLFFLRTGVPVS